MDKRLSWAKESIAALRRLYTWDGFPNSARKKLISEAKSRVFNFTVPADETPDGVCCSRSLRISASDSLRLFINTPQWMLQWRSSHERDLFVVVTYATSKREKIDIEDLFNDVDDITESELAMVDMMYPEIIDGLSTLRPALSDKLYKDILCCLM